MTLVNVVGAVSDFFTVIDGIDALTNSDVPIIIGMLSILTNKNPLHNRENQQDLLIEAENRVQSLENNHYKEAPNKYTEADMHIQNPQWVERAIREGILPANDEYGLVSKLDEHCEIVYLADTDKKVRYRILYGKCPSLMLVKKIKHA